MIQQVKKYSDDDMDITRGIWFFGKDWQPLETEFSILLEKQSEKYMLNRKRKMPCVKLPKKSK